jgi:hypothetical protein
MFWDPSDAQIMALALCPKVTAIASLAGSSLIIYDVVILRKKRSDEISTRHRLLTGMSVCDIMSSSAWFLASWAVPKDMPMIIDTVDTVWNVGNRQTCTAQGFFAHLAIGTVIYNACLALYYLLVIRYGWKNKYIAKRIEPWMHFVAVGFALGTGVVGLALDLFNPFGFACTINAYPPLCIQSFENKGPTNCTRGDNARIFQVVFWLGPACCITVFLAVSMFLVYWKIRTIERGSARFQCRSGRMQQRFILQAFLYVGAMFITWGPLIGIYIYRGSTGKVPNWWVSRYLQVR